MGFKLKEDIKKLQMEFINNLKKLKMNYSNSIKSLKDIQKIYSTNIEKNKNNKIIKVENEFKNRKISFLNEYNKNKKNLQSIIDIIEIVKTSYEKYDKNLYYCRNFSTMSKNIKGIKEKKQINISIKDQLKILEKENSEKDITIENLNKKIENLSNELKNKENLINKTINSSLLLSNNCIKHFIYPKKIIYCLKVDAQIDISNYIDYNKKFNCDWFKPNSSEELNDIIEYFYTNYSLYDIKGYCWIITYGVETDPNEKKVGGYPIKAEGVGAYEGDGNIPGKCNGSGFTAFRKWSSSFANPNYFKKLSNWDKDCKFSIICLQKNNQIHL